jgi:hypothetical protein
MKHRLETATLYTEQPAEVNVAHCHNIMISPFRETGKPEAVFFTEIVDKDPPLAYIWFYKRRMERAGDHGPSFFGGFLLHVIGCCLQRDVYSFFR